MKVKCIDQPEEYFPIIGEVYDVVEECRDFYTIVNDKGETGCYFKNRFEAVPEVTLPPMEGEYKEAVEKILAHYSEKPSDKITYKDFLASMPKSADISVTMFGDGEITINVYGFEFVCKTEARLQEVFSALIVLFKED